MKFLNKLLVVLCLALAGVVIAILITEKKNSKYSDGGGWSSSQKSSTIDYSGKSAQRTKPTESRPEETAIPASSYAGSTQTSESEWAHPKEWYCNVCNSIKKNVRIYLDGPYSCDRSLGNRVLTLASSIEKSVYSSSPDVIEKQCGQLGQDYKRFQDGCSWRAGVRHPQYSHVVSGTQQNSWCAESGWEFVNPGTADLTVRKAKVASRCYSCRGTGRVVVKNRCPNCAGRGRVENTAAVAAQAAVNIVGMFAKKGRQRSIPTGPKVITCPNCQGRGQIQVETSCGTCAGSGQVLR